MRLLCFHVAVLPCSLRHTTHACAVIFHHALGVFLLCAAVVFQPCGSWGTNVAASDDALTEQLEGLEERASDGIDAPDTFTEGEPGRWRTLEPGLQFVEFPLTEGARLSVLRIDPAHFDFVLCARSEDGGAPRTLRQWADERQLTAAINASMYLPDGSTSTGYMRQGRHTNNGRIVQRFGAFFVAGPDDPSLPAAAILDRDTLRWRSLLDRYHTVIQNYRMISVGRRVLWSPGGPRYSISAVGEDNAGHILFMHCRRPVDAWSFARQALDLPLQVRTVMYVEGGGQAGMLIRSPALTRDMGGIHPMGLLVTGNLRATLPNVLGVRRKKVGKFD